jgi:hypothetical protein
MDMKLPPPPVTPDSLRWKPVVRGFPPGFEVLTSYGWLLLEDLYSSNFLGNAIPWKGNGFDNPGYGIQATEYGMWATGVKFPLFAQLNPVTGAIVFVKPSVFEYHQYGLKLVSVKAKGVDFLCSLHTDLWVKPRYGRGFKFVLADDMVSASHKTMYFGVVNKFTENLYGFYKPSLTGEVVMVDGFDGVPVEVHSSSVSAYMDSPISVKPFNHLKRRSVELLYDFGGADRLRTDVPVFTVVAAPFHNMVVRRTRVDDNPRTPWIGGAVVVGDGLDKSLLRVGNVLNAGSGGGAYSVLHPSYRTDSVVRKG